MVDLILAVAVLAVIFLIVAGVMKVTLYKSLTVSEYQQGVLYQPGRPAKALLPGRHYYRQGNCVVINTSALELLLPAQQVLTSDRAMIRITLSVSYRVYSAVTFHEYQRTFGPTFTNLCYLSLRDAISAKSIDDVVDRSAEVDAIILADIEKRTKALGVEISSAIIRDVALPLKLRRAFAGRNEARVLAAQRLELARSEHAMMRSLANTARAYEVDPLLLDARLAHALSSDENSVVFHPEGGLTVTPKAK